MAVGGAVLLGVGGATVVGPFSVLERQPGGLVSTAEARPTTSKALYLSLEDAAFMNRIYGDLTHEIGYCALVSGGGTLDPHLADTVEAGPDSVQFQTGNCPTSDYFEIGFIHTHPNGDPRPSSTDRTTFRRSDFSYTCIQSGPIQAEPGRESRNFRCYTKSTATDDGAGLARVPVVVVE